MILVVVVVVKIIFVCWLYQQAKKNHSLLTEFYVMVFSEKKVKKKTGKDIAGIFSFL
jgi:hypothetical protein